MPDPERNDHDDDTSNAEATNRGVSAQQPAEGADDAPADDGGSPEG